MQIDTNNLNKKGSIKLDFKAYIIILLANPVSRLILPPLRFSAINLTPKKSANFLPEIKFNIYIFFNYITTQS